VQLIGALGHYCERIVERRRDDNFQAEILEQLLRGAEIRDGMAGHAIGGRWQNLRFGRTLRQTGLVRRIFTTSSKCPDA